MVIASSVHRVNSLQIAVKTFDRNEKLFQKSHRASPIYVTELRCAEKSVVNVPDSDFI